ncbi:hypothetical protein FQN54_001921 [Arachnomyces sp. PD_36]|nr:hypothetical protein FQN54_001921 [Arachnomyces sp. PD_36]
MRASDSCALTSSPQSSNEAASHRGSPETRLTAYSPEDARSKARVDSGVGMGPNRDELRAFYSVHGVAHGADPFLAPPVSSERIQLSPTASSFTPVGLNSSAFDARSGPSHPALPVTSGMSFLAANSEPDTHNRGNGYPMHPRQPTEFGPIGKSKVAKDASPGTYVHIGQFDYDNRNRAFAIEGVPTGMAYLNLAEFFSRREFGTLKGPVLTELSTKGTIYVGFTDIRDARCAFSKVQRFHPEWRMHSLTAREYAQKFDPSALTSTSDFEGQIFASVYYDSRNPTLDGHSVSHAFKDLVQTFGDIKAFHSLPTGQENVTDFLIEFFDTRAADNAVFTLNGTSVDGCVLEIKLHKPDLLDSRTNNSPIASKQLGSTPNAPVPRMYPSRSAASIPSSPYVQLSPTGRSTIPIGDPVDWSPKRDELSFRPRNEFQTRYHDQRSSNQNFVDTERIRCGLDVRTTIMLRNIPNKIDQAMLKDIVDETSHGKYDFMYLRIDFANNCNVGYAFINFEDPIDIIDFATARAGRTWNCFNSDKVAEISYATIQGKDCLVQKFRNSSVMLEHPSFRPKIFFTGTGPLAGTEDRFPGPDNPSKMRRSVENAEHVGLFAPRVGQQYRDEQRRRRSQFDRGTTAAEREAFWVRTINPRRNTGASNTSIRGGTPYTGAGVKHWYEGLPPTEGSGPS